MQGGHCRIISEKVFNITVLLQPRQLKFTPEQANTIQLRQMERIKADKEKAEAASKLAKASGKAAKKVCQRYFPTTQPRDSILQGGAVTGKQSTTPKANSLISKKFSETSESQMSRSIRSFISTNAEEIEKSSKVEEWQIPRQKMIFDGGVSVV
jgi:hypothetical protein